MLERWKSGFVSSWPGSLLHPENAHHERRTVTWNPCDQAGTSHWHAFFPIRRVTERHTSGVGHHEMNSTVILIGPLGAGKTTVGLLLAERLGLPYCSVDRVRWAYYQEVGYDDALASRIAASDQGIQGVMRYSKPFEARMVELVLADHHGSSISEPATRSMMMRNNWLGLNGLWRPIPMWSCFCHRRIWMSWRRS